MTVHGVGIDIVCLPRIRALVDRYGEQFENRWFDPSELAQTGDPAVCLARSFAVKEAVWKALRIESIRHLAWRDIVATDHDGSIEVLLSGAVKSVAESHAVTAITAQALVRNDLVIATAIAEI
ncbi:MAG: 4'-phosphopantetheinyl transferase superfamily protein [Propionibacterium sp.]|nr:4'-phosphopantetheinyl transferase superfamily protein [Propionibacterium sp.]